MKLKNWLLSGIWLCLYILCVGLGTIQERSGVLSAVMSVLSLGFFVPGILLLIEGHRCADRKVLGAVRYISLASLVLTLSLIVLNILCVNAGEAVGNLLHELLLVVSAPMFCSQLQGISIFLWACLFVSSFPRIWKK